VRRGRAQAKSRDSRAAEVGSKGHDPEKGGCITSCRFYQAGARAPVPPAVGRDAIAPAAAPRESAQLETVRVRDPGDRGL